jgi:hypothetical protein
LETDSIWLRIFKNNGLREKGVHLNFSWVEVSFQLDEDPQAFGQIRLVDNAR